MDRACTNKILIHCLAIILSICANVNVCAEQPFYRGAKIKRASPHWHQKSTEHFIVFYNNKYIDPESILKMLSMKFNIQPIISGIKIKLYIDDGRGSTIVGAKSIRVDNEKTLIHELTHLLFSQLNPNAPRSIAEGIAIYAESEEQLDTPKVAIKEIIEAEKNFLRTSFNRDANDMQPNENAEAELYKKGFYFVNNFIKERGIEAFKEFYRNCQGIESMQEVWEQAYGK